MKKNECNFCCTKIDKLTVKVDKNKILDNVSIHIHCGELTMLVGPNGAGKSTLIKAMLGEREYTGKVTFSSKHRDDTKLTIGYVPQKLELETSPMSVYDMMAASNSKLPVFLKRGKRTYLKILNHLKEFDADKLVDKRVCDLSGGELQRVLIAMATFPYPELLIMDEPVSGIDTKGKKDFYRIVSKIKKEHDIAVFVVSHDLEYIREYADKVVLLNKKVLKCGTPDEVLNSSEFKEEFKVGMV